ncbi:hypothetical protein GC093_07860, partial [Paenibacillus sp. LMG 31456]|nr:hypothetical protein [Paenibacillus foliorum]
MSDGNVSWVPNSQYGPTVNLYQTNKPRIPVDHVVQVVQASEPKVDSNHPEFVDVTFAVYGTNGQLVDDQTEVFAHSTDSNVTFYNADSNDTQGNYTVKEGYSWYTVNGLVTFVIQSDISNISSIPISLYSGSKLIYDSNISPPLLPSNVASLSSLNLSGITLDQTMSGSVYAYTATVPNSVSVTTTTYSTAESH